jgi:hypothetical protein
MKISDLKKLLNDIRVPSDSYCLNSYGKGDNYFIVNEGTRYIVGYFERGMTFDPMCFFDEESACVALLKMILSDHVVLENMYNIKDP